MNFFIILYLIIVPMIVASTDVCNPSRPLNEFPQGSLTQNTKILSGIIEFEPVSNASSLPECVATCCRNPKCNFAFFKESTNCFLIICGNNDQQSCQPVTNPKKTLKDPIDFLVFVRPIVNFIQENKIIEDIIRREKDDINEFLSSQGSNNQCSPNDNDSCDVNEQCLLNKNTNTFDCVCSKELGFVRVDGVCREHLSNTKGCEMFVDICAENEECLPKNERSKHGTCQCKIDYRRNMATFRCEPIIPVTTLSSKNNRRRPPVSQLSQELISESEKNFWQNFLEEIGLKGGKKEENNAPTTKTPKPSDPAKIFTSDLKANAGLDQNVFYPSRICVLNGSLTSFLEAKKIVRWEWSKDPSSPAFGRFVDTNEAAVVVYENMVEGEYKFILKVWTSEGELSQDFVHVYVHGSANENINQFENSIEMNENMIEIELDIEPSLFNENLKIEFLNKLQNFLKENKQFKLFDPKLVLVNTRISSSDRKSGVVLELLVTDVANSTVQSSSTMSQDLAVSDKGRQICSSQLIVRQLRKKQKSFKTLLNSIQTIIERIQNDGLKNQTFLKTIQQFGNQKKNKKSIQDFLNIKILSIRQMTCFDDRLFDTETKNSYNCSNHGKCDMHTRLCICDKYWMPNYFRYYFDYESDVTNGNNCELNVPLTLLVTCLVGVIVYLIFRILFKYFFYYICCCCLCCRRRIVLEKKNGLIRGFGREKDDSYLNDSIDDDDFKKYQKKSRGFLDRLRSVPGSGTKRPQHKYALLQSEENESLNDSIRSDRFFNKNGLDEQLGAQLKMDDDEDIVYEEGMIGDAKMRKGLNMKKKGEVKKYNLI